jgi:hypothetical protein
MKRRVLVLVTAVLLLFSGMAIGSSVASAPASVPGDGGGLVCNPDRNGVWGWVFNFGYAAWSWHICTYGGAWHHGYYDNFRAAWVRTSPPVGYVWYTNRWYWCHVSDCFI